MVECSNERMRTGPSWVVLGGLTMAKGKREWVNNKNNNKRKKSMGELKAGKRIEVKRTGYWLIRIEEC